MIPVEAASNSAKANATDSTGQQLGHLAKLPREVRDLIYVAFCGHQSVLVTERSSDVPGRAPKFFCSKTVIYKYGCRFAGRPFKINYLLVSRQFSMEVAHILFSTNHFRFAKPVSLEAFGLVVPEKHKSLVSSVELIWLLSIDETAWACALDSARTLLQMPNLQYIRLEMYGPFASYDETGRIIEQLWKSVTFPNLKLATIEIIYSTNATLQPKVVQEPLRFLDSISRLLAGDV